MDIPAILASLARLAPDLRGKSTLGWQLMRWLDRHHRLTGSWLITLRDGTRFELPRKSPMAWAIAFRGSYDSAIREVVASYIEPGTLVLDIGASLGLWTIPLARRASMAGARVLAFEPHPNNHVWIHRNLRLNGLEGVVEVHETALGDEQGTVMMDLGEAGLPGSGGNAAIAVGDRGGVSVPIATLDSIPRQGRVSVIKIDVEGFEIRTLRGASQLIASDQPVIFGEFNERWLQERGEDAVGLLDDLRGEGYDVFAVEGLRTRSWRATDTTHLRLLEHGHAAEDLLLIPQHRYVLPA